jgi:hypothetical protein
VHTQTVDVVSGSLASRGSDSSQADCASSSGGSLRSREMLDGWRNDG